MDKLILADIQALAASIDYGGSGFLQPASAALGLSAALFLSNLDLWQGASYSLTDAEIDDIQAMIAQLEDDLIETGDMYPIDMCKVTRSANYTVPHFTDWTVAFTDSIYDPQGMHNPVVQNSRITPVNAGLHIISGAIQWDGNSIGYRIMRIWRYRAPDWTYISYRSDYPNIGVNSYIQTLTFQDLAELGDYYIMTVQQTSGIGLDVVANTSFPTFAAVRVPGS